MIRSLRARSHVAVAPWVLLLSACNVGDRSGPTAASTNIHALPPALAICPTNVTASAAETIGHDGGSVEVAGSRIAIPAGALREPTLIRFVVPAGLHMRVDITANDADHFSFERPVVLTISYARCRRPSVVTRRASVWYVHETTGELLEDLGGDDDPLAETVRTTIGHLSTYAVAY